MVGTTVVRPILGATSLVALSPLFPLLPFTQQLLQGC
jgi:hypothetical protein